MRASLTVAALLAAAFVFGTAQVSAAELIMYRRDGCPYCAAWDRQVGTGYSNSELGKVAPIRMIDIHATQPHIELKSPIIYTPTFVLIHDGREIGRIEGFSTNDFFYGMLTRLVGELPPDVRSGLSAPQ
jgi:thioredoxin-related protein